MVARSISDEKQWQRSGELPTYCGGAWSRTNPHPPGGGDPDPGPVRAGYRHYFFCSIYRGEHQTASEKVRFTMTFGPRRFAKMPRLSSFARLG